MGLDVILSCELNWCPELIYSNLYQTTLPGVEAVGNGIEWKGEESRLFSDSFMYN